jgi:hypothetical protein
MVGCSAPLVLAAQLRHHVATSYLGVGTTLWLGLLWITGFHTQECITAKENLVHSPTLAGVSRWWGEILFVHLGADGK